MTPADYQADIARLEAEIERIQNLIAGSEQRAQEAEAENERLVAALQGISNLTEDNDDSLGDAIMAALRALRPSDMPRYEA